MENLFKDNEMKVLEECREDIANLVDDLAIRLHKAGKIKSRCKFLVYINVSVYALR